MNNYYYTLSCDSEDDDDFTIPDPPDPPDPPTLSSHSILPISLQDESLQRSFSKSLHSFLPHSVRPSVTLAPETTSTSTSTATHLEESAPNIKVEFTSTVLPRTAIDPAEVNHIPEEQDTTRSIGFGFSDGGFLETKEMATGWWISDGEEIVQSSGDLLEWPSTSNNVAEYTGLIKCLRAAHALGLTHFVMTMDSLLVVSQLKGVWSCQSSHLQELLREARTLADAFQFFIIFHTFREDNTVADALCNLAFNNTTPLDGNWNELIMSLDWKKELNLIRYWVSKSDLRKNWDELWALVQTEIRSIGPMIRDQWKPEIPSFDAPHHPITEITVIQVDQQTSNEEPTWPYVFSREALVEMKALVAAGGLPWDPERFKTLDGIKNKHGVIVYEYPTLDAAYTTLILSRVGWDIQRLIHAWRGQTPLDMRPNKKLDFARLRDVTGGYDDQAALKSLIDSGYQLHWRSTFDAPRPLPKNHLSAELNHEIMGAQILKNYHSGRLILINADDVAANVPGFTTSPYACVPKAHKPLTHACRPIHDQSSPNGASVNEQLDANLRPNAQWPASRAIADRIITATALYGTEALYGFNTDIADAFLNIGLHADDVPINGGLLPASNLAALATTAIFGNCESPGAFKILNCVSHIHSSNSSYIGNDNTPFDVRFYVDDGNCIEPNIGDRLLKAESSLRSSTELVFGANCIQETKTTPWAKIFTSLGFEWNLNDGTVSIPEEKLGRVRDYLQEFSAKKTASVSEFRSVVGKLRHVSTVCPPAKALMHLLGLKLHSKHHVNGRQHRPVTPAMRSELRWWADHLTPSSFYKLPVEWMGTALPPVNQWVHVYTSTDVGVWLVDFDNHTSGFQPWLSSLAQTLITAIEVQLEPSAAIQHRMFHTRFIMNECGMARMINSGSSSNSSLQLPLRKSGLWQLKHRHRFTATSTKWEHMPELSVDPCILHSSNFTNFLLSSQISWTTKSVALSQNRLINGNSLRLAKAPSRLMERISVTGSHSRSPFSCPPSFSTNSRKQTSPRSWLGLPLPAASMVITPSVKEISSRLIRSRSPRSSGLTNIIEMLSSSSTEQPCLSSKLVTGAHSTCPIRRNLSMRLCCPVALRNSAIGTSPKGNWRGGAYCYNSSTLEEQEKFGIQVDKPSTRCQLLTSTPSLDRITESKLMTWSSGTNLETTSRSAITTMPSQLPSLSTTPKPTKLDAATRLRWERLDTDRFARSRALSWPFVHEQHGKSHTRITPCRVESVHPESTPSSKGQLKWQEWTQVNTLSTPSESGMQRCYSKRDTTNSSSASQEDGRVKWSPYTLESPVACC